MKTRIDQKLMTLLAPVLPFLALLACGGGNGEPAPAKGPEPPTATAETSGPPAVDELANTTFAGILDEPVQLIDGSWQGEPFVEGGASAPAVGLVQRFHLTGDLTGDGDDEAAVLLWTSSGGSGTFDYLAVAGRGSEGVEILGTAELGDRIQVRHGKIVDRKIELEVIEAGPEDAACCPTQLATRVWELDSRGLTEVSSEITGSLSPDLLTGSRWVLSDFAWDEPAASEPAVTLAFEEERVAGSAGCNNYFAGIEIADDSPGSISFSAIGSTRMMCPEETMAIEDRFLAQLASVTSYSFLAGHLALSWQDEMSAGVMLLAPATGPTEGP